MSKLMSLSQAVAQLVRPGCHLALGGFVTSRKPYAAVHEILRQGVDQLLLNGGPAGGDVDLLIGAGRVRAYLNYYTANSGYSSVCRMFRLACEHPELSSHYAPDGLPVEDYSLDVYAQLMHAAALGQPFLVTRYMLGSDLAARWGISREQRLQLGLPPEKLRLIDHPFAPGEQLAALPLLRPDVAIIHCQKASEQGLVRIEGGAFSDIDLAMASRHTIITCEEVVEHEWLRQQPGANSLPGMCVDAVCHVPRGAHPSQVYNYYDYDRQFLRDYDQASRDQAGFDAFVQHWVYDVADQAGYLARLGEQRLNGLDIDPSLGYVPFEQADEQATAPNAEPSAAQVRA